MMCLDQEHAEVVLAEDFYKMVGLIDDGLGGKKDIFKDFKVTDCDIFGGHVSGVDAVIYHRNLVPLVFLIPYLVFKELYSYNQ